MITHPVRRMESNKLFMTLWKVAGELQSPKNITRGMNVPNGVMNAARNWSSGLIRILLNSQRMSSLVKIMAEVRLIINWSMSGRGYITAHTNFLLSCNIGHYGKGNRSRLTLLQRCSAHMMTCRNQFVRIPLSPFTLPASRAVDNL